MAGNKKKYKFQHSCLQTVDKQSTTDERRVDFPVVTIRYYNCTPE